MGASDGVRSGAVEHQTDPEFAGKLWISQGPGRNWINVVCFFRTAMNTQCRVVVLSTRFFNAA